MKKRERDIAAEILAATDDLVNTIRAKAEEFAAGEADGTDGGRRRVRRGEAWAVRSKNSEALSEDEDTWWVAADFTDVTRERFTPLRSERWLFSTRKRATEAADKAQATSPWWVATDVVRVTFYAVQREKA